MWNNNIFMQYKLYITPNLMDYEIIRVNEKDFHVHTADNFIVQQATKLGLLKPKNTHRFVFQERKQLKVTYRFVEFKITGNDIFCTEFHVQDNCSDIALDKVAKIFKTFELVENKPIYFMEQTKLAHIITLQGNNISIRQLLYAEI